MVRQLNGKSCAELRLPSWLSLLTNRDLLGQAIKDLNLDQLPAGFTTGFHAHTNADEFFYVISGTGTASIDEEDVPIGPGDFIFVPTAGKHKMSVADTGPMEIIFFLDEPGLEEFFREAHALYFSQSQTMSLEECNAIGQKYGMVCITER